MKKRKILAILMACVITVLAFGSPVSAAYVGNIVQANDSTYRIPENVAEIMASFFIRDMQMVPDNTWTEDTIVADSQVMYDTDGSVSAYSFELATDGEPAGYVVISAYPNLENKILEFSDVSEPVYSDSHCRTEMKWSTQGPWDTIKTPEAPCWRQWTAHMLAAVRSQTCGTDGGSADSGKSVCCFGRTASVNAGGDYPIDDPFEFAESIYGGSFASYDYINEFEPFCNYRSTINFPNVPGCCGVIAITNLIEMIGGYWGYSSINNTFYRDIFDEVLEYGTENNYYDGSSGIGGTDWATLPDFIEGAFSLFDVNVTTTNDSASFII